MNWPIESLSFATKVSFGYRSKNMWYNMVKGCILYSLFGHLIYWFLRPQTASVTQTTVWETLLYAESRKSEELQHCHPFCFVAPCQRLTTEMPSVGLKTRLYSWEGKGLSIWTGNFPDDKPKILAKWKALLTWVWPVLHHFSPRACDVF